MRTIIYERGHKVTLTHGNGAQYRKTKNEDRQWVLDELRRMRDNITQVEKLKADESAQDFLNEVYRKRDDLPRRGRGSPAKNSLDSFINGVIDNLETTQNDLSEKVCDGLEVVFRAMSDLINDNFEPVVFVEGKLNEPLPQPEPVLDPNGLFDFGDFTITISVQRKR